MPVVVSGADQPLGRAVALALAASDAVDVRATVLDRAAVAELAGRGVRAAVCDVTDEYRFGAVLANAHTLIHLAWPATLQSGTPDAGGSSPAGAQVRPEPLDTLPAVLAAAQSSGLRRIVTVSSPDRLIPDRAPCELVVMRTIDPAPTPELVGALVEADRHRGVGGRPALDLDEGQCDDR